MEHKDTLKPYIDAKLQAGASLETIKQQLVANGWNDAVVDEVLQEFAEQSASPAPPETPAPAVFGSGPQSAEPSEGQPAVQSEAPENYTVIQAFKDAYAAIKNNYIGVGATAAISVVALAVAIAVSVVVGLGALLATFALSSSREAMAVQAIFLVIGIVLLMMALSTLASAFGQAVTGLAINDGADGKKSALKETILMGMKRSIRVIIATALFNIIIMSPLLLIGTIALSLMLVLPSLVVAVFLLGIVFLLGGVAAIGSMVLVARLLIMPIVALFETDVPLSRLYGRTRQLMAGGGSWFAVRYLLVILAVSFVLSIIFPKQEAAEDTSPLVSVTVYLVGSLVYLLFSAVLIVFYRNRRAVRPAA